MVGRKSRFKRQISSKAWLRADPNESLGRVVFRARYSYGWRTFLIGGSILAITAFIASAFVDASPWDLQTVIGAVVMTGLFTLGALEVCLARVTIAENGIEERNLLGRVRRWSYRSIRAFEMTSSCVRIFLADGHRVKVFQAMAPGVIVTTYLRRYCPPVIADPNVARWTVSALRAGTPSD